MRLLLAVLAAFFAFAPAAHAQSVRTVSEGTNIDWSYENHRRPARYRVGDVDLTIRGRPDPEYPDLITPILEVAMPGLDPIELEGSPTSPTFEHRVTVGHWDASRPFVMFQSFSGGAHCCNMIQLVVPENGRLEKIELGEWDGDYLEELPTDLDGDGQLDFVLRDDAFLYAFSSYADSFAPPQVINVEEGRAVEVSDRPAFRALFESAMADARLVCREEHANGACAAYVATAARLGRFDEAWAEMLEAYDRSFEWPFPVECRIEAAAGECPASERIDSYPEALRQFLIDQGYIAG